MQVHRFSWRPAGREKGEEHVYKYSVADGRVGEMQIRDLPRDPARKGPRRQSDGGLRDGETYRPGYPEDLQSRSAARGFLGKDRAGVHEARGRSAQGFCGKGARRRGEDVHGERREVREGAPPVSYT